MKLTIKQYLQCNVEYQLGREWSGHSFPCGVWTPSRTFINGDGTWKSLMEHGQLPRNLILIQIEEVPYAKEVTKYDPRENR